MKRSKSTARRATKLVSSAVLMTLFSGCAMQEIARVDERADDRYGEARAMAADMREAKSGRAMTVHSKGFWVDTRPMTLSRETAMRDCAFTWRTFDEVTLGEVTERVRKICGVRMVVSSDVGKDNRSSTVNADRSRDDGPRFDPRDRLPMIMDAVQTEGPLDLTVRADYQGQLSGFLDTITAQLGVSWRYEADTVRVFRLETRSFAIHALPGTDSLVSAVSNSTSAEMGTNDSSGGGGGGGGGSSGGSGGGSGNSGSVQNLTSSIKRSVQEDIAKTLQSMLSSEGKLVMSSSTSQATITDTPDVLDRVGAYIESINQMLTTQVALDIKVLSVTLNREDRYGIDWKAAYQSASALGGWINGFGLGKAADGQGNVQILKGPFANTNALLNALSEQGKVAVVTQPSVTTLNLQAVPMQVATQTSYVSSVSNNQTANVGSSTTITPGTVTTGFNMLLMPYAMADKQLLLQYNISLSDLKSMETFGDKASGQVQLPTVDMRTFSQRVRLRSGETLALTGFEQNRADSRRSGVGDPNEHWLGGGRSADQAHTVMVVLITPRVLANAAG